jgi:aspartyl aminopeptidase
MIKDFFRFLENSPTPYHTQEQLAHKLQQAGYSSLQIKEPWELEKNKGYYLCHGSFIAAFFLPKKIERLSILASHTDSPAIKIKPHPTVAKHNLVKLNTAIYGGPIFSTWTNKDLGIAGKIIYKDKKGNLSSCLIDNKDSPVIICQPAIHIHRKINEEGINACNLQALISTNKEFCFADYLKEKYLLENILDFDLLLYPLEPPRKIGLDHSLISAYRLDNLASVYTSLRALIDSSSTNTLQMCLFYDHEEIGSKTLEGASSGLLDEILERIIQERNKVFLLKKDSLCLSCDLSHGYEEDYKDKFDIPNTPHLGKGIVIKYDGQKKYVTSLEGSAILQMIAEKNTIPLQRFHNKSDARTGSTIGPIFESAHQIPTVDIGLSCLSMHATKEIISLKDFEQQYVLLKSFLSETYTMMHL